MRKLALAMAGLILLTAASFKLVLADDPYNLHYYDYRWNYLSGTILEAWTGYYFGSFNRWGGESVSQASVNIREIYMSGHGADWCVGGPYQQVWGGKVQKTNSKFAKKWGEDYSLTCSTDHYYVTEAYHWFDGYPNFWWGTVYTHEP